VHFLLRCDKIVNILHEHPVQWLREAELAISAAALRSIPANNQLKKRQFARFA
jgi:hypothetical protein